LLGVLPDGTELTQFLPADQSLSPTHGQPADDRSSADLRLQRRGALSATLVAALELARDERLDLRQGAPFGAIRVHSPPER
jgi:chromatin segregation and condensation protein Rec8/ScpA/Scc1 (kleisin family)